MNLFKFYLRYRVAHYINGGSCIWQAAPLITLLLSYLLIDPTHGLNYEQYSFVVKMYYNPIVPGEKPLLCTGAIYNSRWVITSVRCAEYSLRRVDGNATHDYGDVSFGKETRLSSCSFADLSTLRFVEEAVIPTSANASWKAGWINPDDDIALLRVNKPFPFSRFTRPLRIGTEKECDSPHSVLVGWGVTGSPAIRKGGSNSLRHIEMLGLPEKECNHKVPNFNSTARFCTKPVNETWMESTCEGDRGAPLIKWIYIKLRQAPVRKAYPILCGILSFPFCERTDVKKDNVVEYFTSVFKWAKWLKKIAGQQDIPD